MSLLRAVAILVLVCLTASPVVCQGTAYSLSLYVPNYSPLYTWSSSSSPSVTVSLPPFERVNVTAVSFIGVSSINGTCGTITAAPSSVYAPPIADYRVSYNFTCSYTSATLANGQRVAISLTLVWVGPITPQPVALSPVSLGFASITSMATATDCSTLLVVASTVPYNYGGSIYEMSPSFTLGRSYTGTFTDAAADANFVYGLGSGYGVAKLSRSTGAVVGQYALPIYGDSRSVVLDPINNVLFIATVDNARHGSVIRLSAATMTLLSNTTVPILPGGGQTLTARYSPSLQSVVIAQQSPAVHYLYNESPASSHSCRPPTRTTSSPTCSQWMELGWRIWRTPTGRRSSW